MQYVGRFVSTVYNTITPSINPATLSGAIDVIVVERPVEVEEDVTDDEGEGESGATKEKPKKKRKRMTTEFASTPFHVRFGKMSVLRPAERKVTLHLNNSPDPLPFAMKVGPAGEAFFVLELDENQSRDGIPDDLVTSPILSAASSPMLDGDESGETIGDEPGLEPLDLGASASQAATTGEKLLFPKTEYDNDSATDVQSTTAKSGTTHAASSSSETGATTPSAHERSRSREGTTGKDDEETTKPKDSSGKSGSGPAGEHSLLGRMGEAASEAGGALGAAGRAVANALPGGANPRLEKLANKEGSGNDGGAPLEGHDRDEGAGKFTPEKGGSDGKNRLQQQDEANPPPPGEEQKKEPKNETERLELAMRERSENLMEEGLAMREREERAKHEASQGADSASEEPGSPSRRQQVEERYPEPFGENVESANKDEGRADVTTSSDLTKSAGQERVSGTRPASQSEHVDFLGGKKLPRVNSAHGEIPPTQMDMRSIKGRLEKRKESLGGAQEEGEVEEGEGAGEDEDRTGDESVGTVHASAKGKEDLQYMLDMDGYKMTADGEDLAFAEGRRFAKEMPLSRRHGGDGARGHPEALQGRHAHLRKKMSSSSSSAGGIRTPTRRRSFGDRDGTESPSSRSAVGRLRLERPTSSSSNASDAQTTSSSVDQPESPDMDGFRFGSKVAEEFQKEAGAVGRATSSEQASAEQLQLSRDLVRLARSIRPMGVLEDPASRDILLGGGGKKASSREGSSSGAGRSASLRRIKRDRASRQEVSLSDTEADYSAPTYHRFERARHVRATSADTELGDAMAGDGTPPRFDHDGRAQSPDFEWGWGELPKERERGSADARARVVSTADADVDAAKLARGIDLEAGDLDTRESASSVEKRSGASSAVGKLSSAPQDPYVLRLELEDASHEFQLSLCHTEGFGEDGAKIEEDEYRFEENRVSFQRFLEDPELVNDERLVVLYRERFLTWENASAVLATLSLYRKTLSISQSERSHAAAGKEGREGRSSRASVFSRWWNRSSKGNADLEASAADEQEERRRAAAGLDRAATDSALAEHMASATAAANDTEDIPALRHKRPADTTKTYAKTLRLTSDQLRSLNLKKGANTITFSVTSSYSGVATCSARIFLWESTHKIVVSDIDGTITKSDALGHVFTMIGRDWTHLGVAKLYTDIARNGYRIMYLTSRAIGQADGTRDYLRGIRQNNYQLPDGPVIMSPDRLMASLHREVILRKPEVFKMACLRDIARLFGADPRTAQAQPGGTWPGVSKESIAAAEGRGAGGDASPAAGAATAQSKKDGSATTGGGASVNEAAQHPTPFYAGFGNRITDALSYRSVNIPSSRIFTIDHNGEVKMELLELAGYKSSYIHMTDLVDQMFPPITQRSEKSEVKPEFNDFNYWRPDIPEFELPPDDELLPTPPVSPALSARSGRSLRSVRSNASIKSAQTVDGVVGGGSAAGAGGDAAQQQGSSGGSRLSRFGLGSLGLSRKGSAQTVASTPADEAAAARAAARQDRALAARRLPSSSSAPDVTALGVAEDATPALPSSAAAVARPGSSSRADSEPVAAGAEAPSYGSGVSSWASSWRRRAASPGASTTRSATSPLVGPVITAEPDSDEDEEDDDVSEIGEGDGEDGGRRLDEEDEGPYDDEEEEEEDVGVQQDGIDVEEEDELLQAGEIKFDWRG